MPAGAGSAFFALPLRRRLLALGQPHQPPQRRGHVEQPQRVAVGAVSTTSRSKDLSSSMVLELQQPHQLLHPGHRLLEHLAQILLGEQRPLRGALRRAGWYFVEEGLQRLRPARARRRTARRRPCPRSSLRRLGRKLLLQQIRERPDRVRGDEQHLLLRVLLREIEREGRGERGLPNTAFAAEEVQDSASHSCGLKPFRWAPRDAHRPIRRVGQIRVGAPGAWNARTEDPH